MKRLSLLAAVFLVSLVGMVGVSSAEDKAVQTAITQLQDIQMAGRARPATVNPGVPVKPQMYYLTMNSVDGGDAVTACDSGFHMASISEIQVPSNLQYASRSTTAYDSLVDDSQDSGPPLSRMGWVRSGVYPPSGFVYDCDDHLATRDHQSGTTFTLYALLLNLATAQPASHQNTWWHVAQHECSQPEPVWCVEDPD